MNRTLMILGVAALAVAGAVFAQDPPAKAPAKKSAPAGSATRGKEVFEKKCGVCHNADSDAKKIGPGLKGLSKRGTFHLSVQWRRIIRNVNRPCQRSQNACT